MQTKFVINASSDPSTEHPDYFRHKGDWDRIRDCMQSESVIKRHGEKYLPRPAGMTGDYADAYAPYVERAHFPQICSYALQGALGVIITKLPEFNVPKQLEYLKENATKEGDTIQQLFLDTIIEILQTGKCPLIIDIVPETNQFKFVRYSAESFSNWKEDTFGNQKSLILGVFKEDVPDSNDMFSHDVSDGHRVLYIDQDGKYTVRVYEAGQYVEGSQTKPAYLGKTLDRLPLFLAGSINNSTAPQQSRYCL